MGQARNRGTHDERVAQAQADARAQQRMRAANDRQERASALQRAEEERQRTRAHVADRRRPVVLVGHGPRRVDHGHGKTHLMMALALLGAMPAMIAPLPQREPFEEFARDFRKGHK